jgi:hypothetical protein
MESCIGITPGTSHSVYNRALLQASLSFLLWVGPITASLNPGVTDGRCIVRFQCRIQSGKWLANISFYDYHCLIFPPFYLHQDRSKYPSLLALLQADHLTSTSLPNSILKAPSSHVEANSHIWCNGYGPLWFQRRLLHDCSVLTLSP